MGTVERTELVAAANTAELDQLMQPNVLHRVGILLRGWCSSRSENTIRSRFGDLRLFASFLRGGDCLEVSGDVPVRSATMVLALLRGGEAHAEAVVAVYIEWMAEQDYAPTTKARRIATLRSWSRHLHRKQAAPCDLHGVPIPRFDPYNNAKGPPLSKVRSAIAALAVVEAASDETADKRFLALRDKTILVLLMLSFVRRTELLQLNWGDIDASEPERTRIRVKAKGGRLVWKDIGRMGADTLQHWHAGYERRFGTPRRTSPVIVGISGSRLGSTRLYQILQGLVGVGPHGIRHTGAGALAGDLAAAHKKLGHKSMDTTKVYLDALEDREQKGTDAIAGMLAQDE